MRKHSIQTEQVFAAFLTGPSEELYGYELVKATGLPSGSVYPILRRLEDRGWLIAREEVIDPDVRRPRSRIYYRLSADGRRVARQAIHQHAHAPHNPSLGWQT